MHFCSCSVRAATSASRFGLVRAVLHLQAAILQSAANGGQQLLALEGLQQVVIGAVADGGQGDRDVVHGSNHDYGHIGKLSLVRSSRPMPSRSAIIRSESIEFKLFAGIEHGQGFEAGSGLPGLVVGGGKHGRNNLADWLFVIDNQNAVWRHKCV